MAGPKALRATLEDTISNQEGLRAKIDELARENRTVRDDEERKEILKLLAMSCLGVDGKQPFNVIIQERKIVWPHLGYAIRRLSYWDGNNDKELNGLTPTMIWHTVLYHLFIVFSPALDKATSISKELVQFKKEVPRGYEWMPRESQG